MWGNMKILIGLLLSSVCFAGDVSDTSLTFGSTFNTDPKIITVFSSGQFGLNNIPVWLRVDPVTAVGPGDVKFYADVKKVPTNGDTALVNLVTRNGTTVITILAKCSSSSGCGGGTVVPTPTPVVNPTPVSTPVVNPTPVSTPVSTPQPTVAPTPPITIPVGDDSVTAPVHPTYREVSTKLDKIVPYVWYQGKTATQTQRDAMEETRAGIAMPEVLRYARTIPGCKSSYDRFAQGMSEITAKLGPVYEIGISLKEGTAGHWSVDPNGRHYSIENYAFRAVAACSVKSASECAASPLMNANLLDLMNMRIENGKCITGALFTVPPPTEKRNGYRERLGMVQADTLMPALTAQQLQLLDASHAAHHAVTEFKCGTGPAPAAGIVLKSHIALEATARTEAEHHFLRLKDFSGAEDPLWTRAEVCKWARIQDKAHHAWKDQVLLGKWGRARLMDNDHLNAHICMGLKTDKMLVRFSCDGPISSCPKETCEQYLARTAVNLN